MVETTRIDYNEMLCIDIPWSSADVFNIGSGPANPPTNAKSSSNEGETGAGNGTGAASETGEESSAGSEAGGEAGGESPSAPSDKQEVQQPEPEEYGNLLHLDV